MQHLGKFIFPVFGGGRKWWTKREMCLHACKVVGDVPSRLYSSLFIHALTHKKGRERS